MTTLDPRAVKAALDAYGIDAVVDGLEAAIAAYLAATQPQAGEPVAAHGYATRLLTSLMEKHYPDRSPEWAPLPDLYGVLTQIDNLSTGLVRASPQPASPAQVTDADLTARLKEIAVEVFPSANKFAVADGVKNIIRILESIEPSEYAVLHRSMFPFSYDRADDCQPTEAQEWNDYDPDC